MKIRTDFVSNSSSSSFIIAKCDLISKLTKQDFIDAISDMYDVSSNNQDCYGSIFEILDKNIEEDKNKINSDYTEWLEWWYSDYLYMDNEHHWTYSLCYSSDLFPSNSKKWCNFYETLQEIYQDLPFNWNPTITETDVYNRETKKFEKKEIDKNLYKILTDTFTKLGIISHRKAIQCDLGRLLIHFNDNEIYNIDGMCVPGKHEDLWDDDSEYVKERNEKIKNSIYETNSHTPERFCEILVNWFKEKGKLPSETTWEEFSDSIIGCCLHEG